MPGEGSQSDNSVIPVADLDASQRLAQMEAVRQSQRGADGELPPPLPRIYYEMALLGFSVVQWEPPQLSFCRGTLHALRKHALKAAAEAARKPTARSKERASNKAPIPVASPSPAPTSPGSHEQMAKHADAVRLRLRKQAAQLAANGRVEQPYVTAMSGVKKVTKPGK